MIVTPSEFYDVCAGCARSLECIASTRTDADTVPEKSLTALSCCACGTPIAFANSAGNACCTVGIDVYRRWCPRASYRTRCASCTDQPLVQHAPLETKDMIDIPNSVQPYKPQGAVRPYSPSRVVLRYDANLRLIDDAELPDGMVPMDDTPMYVRWDPGSDLVMFKQRCISSGWAYSSRMYTAGDGECWINPSAWMHKTITGSIK